MRSSASRGEMWRNRLLRAKLRRAIMNSISGAGGHNANVPVGIEMDVSVSWRRCSCMRKVKNNLGLDLVYIGSD